MSDVVPGKRSLFGFLLLAGGASVAALSACAGGTGAPTLPAASPAPASLPTLAAPVTVPLSNPSPGQPLSVTFPFGTGRAAISFPIGTTVTAGTQIVVKSVTVPASELPQSAGRRIAAAGIANSTEPGLYVQVLDGLITTGGGSSQNFTPGEFGFVGTFQQPPIILPPNPGAPFTVQPSYVPGGQVTPIGADGKPGTNYITYSNGNGGMIIPITNSPTGGGMTLVLNSSSSVAPVNYAFSSTGSVTAGTAASTLTLPEILAALDATLTFGPTTGASSVLNATFQTNLPAAATTTAAHARVQAAIGGAFTVDDAVSVTPATTATFTQTPAFTFGLNEPNPPLAGVSYYVALFDANAPSAGLTTFAGPGTVTGDTIAFPSVAGTSTLQAGDTYTYALIHTTQALATPAPTVATLATTVAPSYNTLPLPALSGVLDAAGSMGYNQTSNSTSQSLIVSASTGNFAALSTPSGQTALVYVTVGFTSGNPLSFGPDPDSLLYISGPAIAMGTSYTVTITLPNGSTSTQTTTADFNDAPTGYGDGLIVVPTPLQSLTLTANQILGITISH